MTLRDSGKKGTGPICRNGPKGAAQKLAPSPFSSALSIEDVEHVLANPTSEGISKSTGLPIVWGYTPDEIHMIVVYEPVSEGVLRVITACAVPEP